MTEGGAADRMHDETPILHELQDAVLRMHVVAQQPRVIFIKGSRHDGPRPLAWQVLFERSLGKNRRALRYRGASAASLAVILGRGYDDEPSLSRSWSHARLRDAINQGPVIQAFRDDRLPDDVAEALVGLLVFEEDGLQLEGVRALCSL